MALAFKLFFKLLANAVILHNYPFLLMLLSIFRTESTTRPNPNCSFRLHTAEPPIVPVLFKRRLRKTLDCGKCKALQSLGEA
jgi:hypothetical protein